MSQHKSPSVTFMIQFSRPYNHIDYTNREEAVDIDNELSLDQGEQQVEQLANGLQYDDGMTRQRLDSISAEVPEENLSFRKYIDYMNRNYATKEYGEDGLTAVFNETSNHLKKSEVQEYKTKLDQAYDNHSLMWKGVVSFDTEFLAQQGLFDKETKKVDQQGIKGVIRDAMPELLKQEGMSGSAFWWGNIHLNTNHTHVHIGISEVNSSRPIVKDKLSGAEEYRGYFSKKTIKSFKSDVYNGLLNEHTKARKLRKEQVIANIKSDLVEEIKPDKNVSTEVQQFYLSQMYNHLPKDRKWRYGSNAKDFSVAKIYLDKYLDSYLENDGEEEFDRFKEETSSFLSMYETAYTSNSNKHEYEEVKNINGKKFKSQRQTTDYHKDQLMERRINDLRERLGNKVLKYVKENPPIIEEGQSKNFSVANIKYLTSEDLSGLIDTIKTGPQDDLAKRQELGIYRYALRQKKLTEEDEELHEVKHVLDHIEPIENDRPFIEFKKLENQEMRELTKLQMTSNKQLSKEQKEKKAALNSKYIDPIKIPISQVSLSVLNEQTKHYQTEIKLVEQLRDQSLLGVIEGHNIDKSSYSRKLGNKIQVLSIKYTINQTNGLINQTSDEVTKHQYQQENGLRFSQLKELYNKLEGNSETQQVTNNSLEIQNRRLNQNSRRKPISKRTVLSNQTHQVTSGAQVSKSFVRGLSQALKPGDREDMKAFMRKVRDDDREEREEEREKGPSR